jgi:hypothetical protein
MGNAHFNKLMGKSQTGNQSAHSKIGSTPSHSTAGNTARPAQPHSQLAGPTTPAYQHPSNQAPMSGVGAGNKRAWSKRQGK